MKARAFILMSVLGLSVLSSTLSARETIFYVSPLGNDLWSGQLKDRKGDKDGPVATLSAALQKARALRQTGSQNSIRILVRNGIYRLDEPLVLTPEDSGLSATQPLVIEAFEKDQPEFTGLKQISGWSRIEGSTNLWKSEIPEVRDGKWHFHQLFVHDEYNPGPTRKQRARTEGFFRINGDSPSGSPAKLKFHPGDIKKEWAQRGDVEVIALLAWADFRMFIRDVDEQAGVATLSLAPQPSNRENNARYYIENTPDALDQPGEWYLDRKAGVLTYCTPGRQHMAKAEAFAPHLQELLLFKGQPKKPVCNIVIRGLKFSGTDWSIGPDGYADTQAAFQVPSAIQAKWTTNCALENCTLTELGGYAIDISRGCRHFRVAGCEISDVGAGGIRIGEPNVPAAPEDANNHNSVVDTHMFALGRVFSPGIGVFILQSGQNLVSHNHIHDLYYTAISVGWTWGYDVTPCCENIIEYNHLHDIGQNMLSDMGGIYTLGPQKGTIIRNNLIHDIQAFTYGGWGLYTDEGSTGIVLESNVVYHCKSAGFHQHYGRENIIRNNIFAFNTENQAMRTRAEAHTSFIFTNNIILFDKGQLLGSDWSNDHYVMEHNVYFDTRPNAQIKFSGQSLEDWQKRGHDTNSIIADPQFVDAGKLDFTLKPTSPALKLGFKPIDLSTVGVRTKQ